MLIEAPASCKNHLAIFFCDALARKSAIMAVSVTVFLPFLAVFVFYGFYDPHLSRNDLHAFSDEVFQRSASHTPFVQQAFSRAQQGIQAEFDDRSILFGIAAISYSHAITDIARIWLYVWDQAHGDITGTPHLETLKKKE